MEDNYSVWEQHERYLEAQRERLPVCEGHKCGKRIDEDLYFDVEGEILCEKCMIRKYGRRTEDYNA